MKLLDLLKEGPNDMGKDQKVKRALAIYNAGKIVTVKTNINGQERIYKVVLPDTNGIKLDWSHNGDVIIRINDFIKVYYPPNVDGFVIRHTIFDKVKEMFERKKIHLSIFTGSGIRAIPMDKQINESMEDDKLIKKALEVYKFLRKGTIKYEYDLKGPNLSYGRRKGSVMVKYELPPVENVNVEIHQLLIKPMITFNDKVIYKVVEGERFDEDDLEPGDLIEEIKKRFVKYNVLLIDLNYGDFESQMLDYDDGPYDDEF